MAGALHRLGVPVRIIADLDLLATGDILEKLFVALGGDWGVLEKDWRVIDANVRKGVAKKSNSQVKLEIKNAMEKQPDAPVSISEITRLARQTNAWSAVKNFGVHALPRGDAVSAFSRLEVELNKRGIFLLPVGEVENYDNSIGGHGPAFVSQFLKKNKLGSPKFKDVRVETQS